MTSHNANDATISTQLDPNTTLNTKSTPLPSTDAREVLMTKYDGTYTLSQQGDQFVIETPSALSYFYSLNASIERFLNL